MDPIKMLEELQDCKEDTLMFRKFINYACSHSHPLGNESLCQWQPILSRVIQVFIPNAKIERERMLLASHAFFGLLSTQSSSIFFKDTLQQFVELHSAELAFLNEVYRVDDTELFQLICIHGYLQVNRREIYSHDTCSLMFETLYGNCIKYTNYSYFAYKLLYMWLNRTMETDFWDSCDPALMERLEKVIFSNWCNAISEISKQNSISIFNVYLRIKTRNNNKPLASMFEDCARNISWQNELKYVILTEISEIWDNVQALTSYDFLLSLSTSLTKNHLRCPGTKVYLAIQRKLSGSQWIESFGNVVNYLFHHWENTENTNYSALQLLCKHWIEPAVKRDKEVLEFLWESASDLKGYFVRSHLERMAREMRIDLVNKIETKWYLNHKDEFVRLNGFGIICHSVDNEDKFRGIRNFLWHNANSTSVRMREGIVKYFRIFYTNLLKNTEAKMVRVDDLCYITNWLHEYLLDCFEIGSCYQRKVIGLKLYRDILSFTDERGCKKTNMREHKYCALIIDKNLIATGNWKFTDKISLLALLRLVLDTALDIRCEASSIIVDYFDINILTDFDKRALYNLALKYSNSSKFYNIESGAELINILASRIPLNVLQNSGCSVENKKNVNSHHYANYCDYLLNEATRQLIDTKKDILKSIVQNRPFYGVLTALSKVVFQNGPESNHLTLEFVEKILDLLKDAVEFFLSVLSSKSTNAEYSSSFAEMGLAIDEVIKTSEIDDNNYDDLNLTPAHQVLISCIWMSLKISCEIASEIGRSMLSDETVKQSANIIVTVLIRCRHKGVMEAAGSAIGNLTRVLCNEDKYCDLPKSYITNILQDNDMRSLNITRRGAGLSIMFHKIVVSDNRRDRPLLRFAVEMLLDLLNESQEKSMENVESKHDSPWARRLHFLRALVTDKEIQAQLIPYMEDISLTCFRYLESEIWTIRNASLQLFGAIVPRLVGQSRADSVLDFGTGYPINHFLTHYPVLAEYVKKQLSDFSASFRTFSTELYLHSNIVHILILLSKFSCGGSKLIDHLSGDYVTLLKPWLLKLCADAVINVRLLAAKAFAALTGFSKVESEIRLITKSLRDEHLNDPNLIHGYLLIMKYLRQKLSVEEQNLNSSIASRSRFLNSEDQGLLRLRHILKIWRNNALEEKNTQQPCYVLETLYLQLSESIFDQVSANDIFVFNENVNLLSSQKVQPGFYQFIDYSTKLYASYVKRTDDINPETVCKILDSHCVDQSVAFLNHLTPYVPMLEIILERLFSQRYDNCELLMDSMINFVLNTLRHALSLQTVKLKDQKFVENINIEIEENMQHSTLWRLKCALKILFSKEDEIIKQISTYILSICVHEEEYMRKIAVDLLQFAVCRYENFGNDNKLNVIYSCLVLLKDEIPEIREAIAESLRAHVLPKIDVEYNLVQYDEIIYKKLLRDVMLNRSEFAFVSKEEKLSFIKLVTAESGNSDIDCAIENPFYHNDDTFYKEVSKFLNTCFFYAQQSKKHLIDAPEGISVEHNGDCNAEVHEIRTHFEIQSKVNFDCNNLETVLNAKYAEYLLGKQRIVIQEFSE